MVTQLGENWNSFLEDLERLDAAIEEVVIDKT